MSKQDKCGVRTAPDLERKYNFGGILNKNAKENARLEEQTKQLNQTLTKFMANTNTRFEEIDSIGTHFYSGVPTFENEPAVNWETDELKAEHVGDIYYDTDTSMVYLFKLTDDLYEWVECFNNTSSGEEVDNLQTQIDELSSAIGTKASQSDLISHTSNTSNPHSVTASQVGLGNVPNVTTNNQTPTYTVASSNTALSSGEKLSVAFGKIAKAISSLISHLANKSNPHNVTASQVGLGNVNNTSDVDKPISSATQQALDGKSDITHNHDTSYYTQSEIDDKLSTKSNTSHNHNSLYYTETEIDTKVKSINTNINNVDTKVGNLTELSTTDKTSVVNSINEIGTKVENNATSITKLSNNKANTSDVYTKTETDNKLASKSDTTHNHDSRYYTETEIDTKLSKKSDTTHAHNSSYYLKSEVYTKTETDNKLSTKSDISHNHDSAYYTKSEVYNKTEIDDRLSNTLDASHTHDDRYYTETEIDTMLSEKSDTTHNHDSSYYGKSSVYTKTETDNLLTGKSNTSHTHDDRYYTETEIDNKLSTKANSSHTHDDKYYTETEVDNVVSDINTNVGNVKTRVDNLYNIQKIGFVQSFTTTTTEKTYYTYTATKNCMINLSFTCIYNNSPVKMMKITKNNSIVVIRNTTNAVSGETITACIAINAGDVIRCVAQYGGATSNAIYVNGYVQYLE